MRASQRFINRPIQTHQTDAAEPFFAPAQQSDVQAESEDSFFDQAAPRPPTGESASGTVQTKLTVNAPGDKHEQEADAMADQVVQRMSAPEEKDKVHKKAKPEEEEKVQRMSAPEEEKDKVHKKAKPEEEEKVQRMSAPEEEKDKVHKKSKPEEEEKVQRMSAPEEEKDKVHKKSKPEEEEKVQRMSAPEEEKDKVHKKGKPEEEEPLQRKCAECEKEEGGQVQRQSDGSSTAPSGVTQQIKSSKGQGSKLSDDTRTQMESSFGTDFSQVTIHTDHESTEMNNALHAQAFTHGSDIYFNEGKYNPQNTEGGRLLAHELTHVVQQGGTIERKVQRKIGDGHDLPVGGSFSGNVALEAVFDNERTVNVGNSGAHVTLIQQALIALNYPLPNFGADGTFGPETRRAVEAFQRDVGLGVDGVVGVRTIDFLDKRSRNAEVAPPARPVTINVPFNVANAIVQPGAAPSNALPANFYGLTFPENITVRIDIFDNVGVWQPVLSEVIGNYSLQTRLIAGRTEVTGPAGNTTSGNYCAQINDLNALTMAASNWFMQSAVLAHERVHASFFRQALIDPSVINPLETAIEGITVPKNIIASNAAIAEFLIRVNPAFAAALTAAQANWLTRILAIGGHPVVDAATRAAEHQIVDPMIRRICAHAKANKWAACPPLCP